MSEKPSLELCKSLIMLRDYNISGKINLIDVPALLQTLHYWRVYFYYYRSWIRILTDEIDFISMKWYILTIISINYSITQTNLDDHFLFY